MKNLELTLWKEELQIRKDQNTIKLKELKRKLEILTYRHTFMVDVRDQLQSTIFLEIEDQMKSLWMEQETLKKENTDIDTILYTIDVEVGTIFVCN